MWYTRFIYVIKDRHGASVGGVRVSRVLKDALIKRMSRVTVSMARLRTLTVRWT